MLKGTAREKPAKCSVLRVQELDGDDDPFADLDSDTEEEMDSSRRDGELNKGDSDHEGDGGRLLELFESSDEEGFFGC